MTGHYIRVGYLIGERWLAVIEVALHLPVPEIELALGAAVDARAICAAAAGKRTAEFTVAATKNSRHEIPNFSSYLTGLHRLTSLKIAFDSVTRKIWKFRATF